MSDRVKNAVFRRSKRFSRRGLYEFLEAEYAATTEGQRVLSVGSGGPVNDLLIEHARRNGFCIRSMDVDPGRGPDFVGDICTFDFGAERFDVVVMSEVLEHVHSPRAALANILEILQPGGRLVLTTPFVFPIHDAPYDYFRFTRHGLALLTRDFEGVSIRERNNWAEAINVLLARAAREAVVRSWPVGVALLALAYLSFPPAYVLGRWFRTDFMTTGYVVSARKPGPGPAGGGP